MALDDAVFGNGPQHRPASRGKFRFLTYPFRFFFRLFKRSISGVLRTVGYHPVSSLIIIVLLGTVAFMGNREFGRGLGLGAGPAAETLTPSPAAEDFIKGQTTFNAALMWGSFSDDLKQQLQQRGTSQQSLQRQLDQRKQSGARIDNVNYVGGVETPDGSKLFVYSLLTAMPNQTASEQHYVITVDRNEKIVKVE